jgi:hypothetical protein
MEQLHMDIPPYSTLSADRNRINGYLYSDISVIWEIASGPVSSNDVQGQQ